jgi:hypothetical protein
MTRVLRHVTPQCRAGLSDGNSAHGATGGKRSSTLTLVRHALQVGQDFTGAARSPAADRDNRGASRRLANPVERGILAACVRQRFSALL